jgi:hypothetical protein
VAKILVYFDILFKKIVYKVYISDLLQPDVYYFPVLFLIDDTKLFLNKSYIVNSQTQSFYLKKLIKEQHTYIT